MSDDEVERALRVMDALLIALESEGFRVGVGLLGGYSQTFADVDGERIGFFVDICRAGICFQLSGPLLCRRWGDTTRKTLESRVGEFANAIVAAAPLIRAARARREAEEEAAHAEQARREAAEIARITERNRRRSALRELKQLRRASELRAYAKALGTRHPQSPKVREWATWIGGFADAIDPLKSDPEDLRSVVPEPVKLPEPKVNQWGWPILR